MAEYSNLSATINAQIRANGVQAITGPVLNAVLTAMVNVLGDGYRLKGVAAPADNPGSPDNRVAYLAAQDGTYTNFGGLTISGEVALLLWDSAWTKETLFSIDTAVTPGSGNLVTSGAVDSALTTLANNIAAAYMKLVPAATEGNLAEFDNAGQVRDAELATSDLATKDGHYPDLFAGFAGNLVDTRSTGTRQGPFAFRQSGGDGVNYMRKILGRTEAFNQLNDNAIGYTRTDNGITYTFDANKTRCTLSGTSTARSTIAIKTLESVVAGHRYFIGGIPSAASSSTCRLCLNEGSESQPYIRSNFFTTSAVYTVPSGTTKLRLEIVGAEVANYSPSSVVFQPFIVDLTLMYGAGNEPATVAAFEALHPLPYYNYNAGVLKNNAATGLETTGFNQWDEEWEPGTLNNTNGENYADSNWIRTKNYIPVIPGAEYYVLIPVTCRICAYDSNKNFISTFAEGSPSGLETIPANARYIRIGFYAVTTYNHDICINLSDASRNGIYEPYWKREIVLGLNNLACHDENNNAVVVNGLDGVGTSQDELIVENGWGTKIIKRFAEVDLGTLTYESSAGASGITLYDATVPDVKPAGSIISAAYLQTDSYLTLLVTPGLVWAHDIDHRILFSTIAGAYADAATFKAAMAGVKLRYELATPKVLTLDNPIPALIEVDNLGTEKRLPEDTADNPQAPFECDSNYSVSTANLVRLLNL